MGSPSRSGDHACGPELWTSCRALRAQSVGTSPNRENQGSNRPKIITTICHPGVSAAWRRAARDREAPFPRQAPDRATVLVEP